VQFRLSAPYLVHDAHAANAGHFDEAVVGDGLDDYYRECYFGRTGKSTNCREGWVCLKLMVGEKSPYHSLTPTAGEC
jgi:hypothetical protein